ncbi:MULTISPECIES: uroporphyrinogen-III synthase [Bosea]|uniref:uroporphyrinogen-III synthase n=1 Tax=Bosea TaxID=85413 RepID=UPI00215035F0|nr:MULTISPECIES: uroporphyrinogen-III synthase [Bosea]MCR4521522.1 uroporphyrinogen-III synthase [Bosea sp. 47.2.35]MDR6829267.1 uroporphyrinogen-III synthase [Bosea robiniae]MDR6896218.1 uroporphyrinogen-III synthase [Bosea sp. BE109]MDR7139548.1 uroporphyrinogen-III synthase [Bosea sp. BE168]MDR7176313.1 uroporphyrinogen-III synthase [Bosea sp. BE271]
MRVFVFRPRPDAERTARAIAEHGFEPVVAPLFEVIRLTDAAPEGAFDAIVLTSGNGVPALADGPATWRDLPVFTVGSRTAAKVREAGLDDTRSADGDRNDLIELIKRTLPAPAKLLMIVGRDRKEDVPDRLREAGYEVTLWTAYAAEPVSVLPEDTQAALRHGGGGAALHYSARGARTFIALAQAANVADEALELTHVTLSADVASPLISAGASTVLVAEHPEEAGMLAALQQVSARERLGDPARAEPRGSLQRTPPTVDLQAVSSETAENADEAKPSPEAVAPTEALPQEFSPPPVEPVRPPADRDGPARTPWLTVAAAALVGGVIGGALVSYVLPKPAPSGSTEAIAELRSRIETLQASAAAADRKAAAASDAAAKAGSELQAVTAKLASLGSNAQAPDTSAFSAQAQRAEAAAAAVGQRLDQIAGRLGSVETQAKAAAGASPEAMAAARIVLAERVQRALVTGRPFAGDIAALTKSGVAQADLAALTAVATSGAPTREALQVGFRKHGATFQREVMPASDSWSDKLLALTSRIVTVRPVGDSGSTDPATLPIRLESAIAAGDIVKAAALWGQLPEPARRASAEFGADLQKRAAADAAIAKIAQDAVAALGVAG